MVKKKSKPNNDNVMATNRKARHDYFIEETFEAGIALTGTEIKSVRERRVTLKDGFVSPVSILEIIDWVFPTNLANSTCDNPN